MTPHFKAKYSQTIFTVIMQQDETNSFRNYLPPQPQGTLLPTPQNYMLLLSYTESLEQENASLTLQNSTLRNKNQELSDRNEQLVKQIQLNRPASVYMRPLGATTFGMARRGSHSQTHRDQQNQKTVSEEKWTVSLERQLIDMLKQENNTLVSQIQELYRLNEALLNASSMSFSPIPSYEEFETNIDKEKTDSGPFTKIKIGRASQKEEKENLAYSDNDPRRVKDQTLPIFELTSKLRQIQLAQSSSDPSLQKSIRGRAQMIRR